MNFHSLNFKRCYQPEEKFEAYLLSPAPFPVMSPPAAVHIFLEAFLLFPLVNSSLEFSLDRLKTEVRAGEMAQWLGHLLCKHEYWSWDPGTQVKAYARVKREVGGPLERTGQPL